MAGGMDCDRGRHSTSSVFVPAKDSPMPSSLPALGFFEIQAFKDYSAAITALETRGFSAVGRPESAAASFPPSIRLARGSVRRSQLDVPAARLTDARSIFEPPEE